MAKRSFPSSSVDAQGRKVTLRRTPHGQHSVPTITATWPGEAQAELVFTDPLPRGDTYIIALSSGEALRGHEMLQWLRSFIPATGEIDVVGVAPGVEGFWDKMFQRKLIDRWNDQHEEEFFDV